MTDRTKKLLAVLDIPEKEQRKWLLLNVFHERMPRESNADLAFRLRDETDPVLFWNGMVQVMNKVATTGQIYTDIGVVSNEGWWWQHSKPIHWVIAALIAEEISSPQA